MFSTLFLIAGWLTITPLSDMQVQYSDSVSIWTDSTSIVLLEFSQRMDTTGLTNKNNYKVYDSTNTLVKIYRVGIVKEIGGDDSPIIIDSVGTTVVALQTRRIDQKSSYKVEVFNVKNILGIFIGDKNHATFYFNGFVPHKFPEQQVQLK